MEVSRLLKQLDFIREIDQLKSIVRKSKNFTNERYENDAEHSWHIAVMAMMLSEYSNKPIQIEKVLEMLLIHDLVEIDAGDTLLYSASRNQEKQMEERKAAERIFGLLPPDQCLYWLAIWEEFETGTTAEAHYARAIDRLEPVLQNIHRQGAQWIENGVRAEQIFDKNQIIRLGSKHIWSYISEEIQKVVADNFESRKDKEST